MEAGTFAFLVTAMSLEPGSKRVADSLLKEVGAGGAGEREEQSGKASWERTLDRSQQDTEASVRWTSLAEVLPGRGNTLDKDTERLKGLGTAMRLIRGWKKEENGQK